MPRLYSQRRQKQGTEVNCGTLRSQKFGCNARSRPQFQDMSISYIGVDLIEREGKGVKRKNHQVLDLELTSSTVAKVDEEVRVNAIRHSVNPRPDKKGERDGDSSRSEKQKKADVVISGCPERSKSEGRITGSLKVHRGLRVDNPSIVGRKRDFAMYHKEFEEKRETRKTRKREFDVLVSPERNRWSMTGAEDGTKSSDVHDSHNLNTEMKVLSEEKLHLLGGHDEVQQSKHCAKRSRDGKVRSVVEAKKTKKSATDLHGTEVLACNSKPKGINHEAGIANEINRSQVKALNATTHERVESTKGSRWANQTSNDRHRRYGENHSRCVRHGSQEAKELKAETQDRDVPVKHRGRRLIRFHGGSVNFDGSSSGKDRLVRAISEYNESPASCVKSDRLRDDIPMGQDQTHRRVPQEITRDNRRADRRVEIDLNTVSNRRERDDGTTPTCRVQECEKKPNQSSGFVKEKLKLSSRAVRSDGCAVTDLPQTKYESTSVITNVWEVQRRFSSKVVVPNMRPDDFHSMTTSIREGDHFRRGGDQEVKKSLKNLANRGQDENQEGTELEKHVTKKSSTTRETSSQKFEGTGKADPVHGSELTPMDHDSSRLVSKTKRTSVELPNDEDNTGAKLCTIKERHIRRKLRDTKERSELQGKNGISRSRALSKRSDGLRKTRTESTVSRMSTDIRLSEAIKGGKERTVKSKESLLRRHAIKVGRAKDDGGQRLSSHEPKYHKHRSRSHTLSPKLKNHTLQKKEQGKSISPRRSEDLSNWEKFERERNNTLAAFDSRYRRFGGGTSGLGGYSPRRRRSEAAIKTPSPPPRSPERRKPRAWDLPPLGMDRSMVAAISAAHQAVAQQAAIQHAAVALASVTPIVSGSMLLSPGATSGSASCGLTPPPTMIPSLLQQVNPAVTAVTLTQATRPLRRLYVGNVPVTVSDGELLEFLNAAMLSANANYLAGTKPCINCSVNVDKSYAFAEFITPEDATAALAFDGVTLHGTTLKIRRPKDFAQPANGGAENASSIHDMVSSTVPDSPRKVFVGGISSSLSAEKVKEIVTAFGQLKAYHWEVDKTKQPPQGCAFLEYMDPTATLKACAGLSGMKLGTRFLTVVQATPDASPEVASTKAPSYGVPDHAKALLQAPSRILELQNMVTEDEIRSMSKQEIDEITEDIRVECSRFGNVRSMHIVQLQFVLGKGTRHISDYTKGCGADGGYEREVPPVNLEDSAVASEQSKAAELSLPVDESGSEKLRSSSARDSNIEGAAEISRNTIPTSSSSGPILDMCCRESCEVGCNTRPDTPRTHVHNVLSATEDLNSVGLHVTGKSRTEAMKICGEDTPSESVVQGNVGPRTTPLQEESDASAREVDCLHVGKVYVEFSREESACRAAHNLHGRTFAGRIVTVSYFPLKAYQKGFRKGIGPRTYEEKQALALAVQGHLTAHIKD